MFNVPDAAALDENVPEIVAYGQKPICPVEKLPFEMEKVPVTVDVEVPHPVAVYVIWVMVLPEESTVKPKARPWLVVPDQVPLVTASTTMEATVRRRPERTMRTVRFTAAPPVADW